jgi:hypothetical protein
MGNPSASIAVSSPSAENLAKLRRTANKNAIGIVKEIKGRTIKRNGRIKFSTEKPKLTMTSLSLIS